MATKATRRIPEGCHTITPHIVVSGAAQAIEFYKKAFGAKEVFRGTGPDGKSIMHAELQIGDSMLFLGEEFSEMGCRSPKSLNGTPTTLHIYVEDADAWFSRAVNAGATVAMPIQDAFWGDRYGQVTDPFGHRWAIASRIEDLTPEEIRERAAVAFATK